MSQETDVGESHIAYASRSLKSELNYPVFEKEALAVMLGIGVLRQYLLGHTFNLITSHNPLRWLMGIKNSNGRLANGHWLYKVMMLRFSTNLERNMGKQMDCKAQEMRHNVSLV